jgi:flagellar hook-associated protein 2
VRRAPFHAALKARLGRPITDSNPEESDMATITSTGIGSGLDVSAIISQLMAVESRPLTLLQEAKTDLNSQLSTFGKLQSYTSALRDASQKLASLSIWKQTVATSGDTSAIAVSTDSSAAISDYAISVQSLAKQQTLSSQPLAGVNEGTLTIELGAWTGSAEPRTFAPKSGASAVQITIGAGETSLAAVRDKINAAGAGVTASIVTDASGSRLALRSSTTGAENGFRITAGETIDDGSAATGLSALVYDATQVGASTMALNQSAANATATINGIGVSSATNTLTGVADGLTLTLQKETTDDVAVSVKGDREGLKSAITGFTKAFNDLAAFIRDQTKYDPETKVGGALQGDRTAVGLQSQLRGVLNAPTSASSVYTRLADIGITMQKDGTLATDSTKLESALDNPAELKKLLFTDGANSDASGFMDRFRDLGDALLTTDGAFDARTDALNAMIKRNDTSQAMMQNRLTQTEKRLRKQYETLDTNIAKLSGLSNYLTGQLAALAANSGG